MDWTTPVPFRLWLVGMVVTTVWVLRLTTEIPPSISSICDVEVARTSGDDQGHRISCQRGRSPVGSYIPS